MFIGYFSFISFINYINLISFVIGFNGWLFRPVS